MRNLSSGRQPQKSLFPRRQIGSCLARYAALLLLAGVASLYAFFALKSCEKAPPKLKPEEVITGRFFETVKHLPLNDRLKSGVLRVQGGLVTIEISQENELGKFCIISKPSPPVKLYVNGFFSEGVTGDEVNSPEVDAKTPKVLAEGFVLTLKPVGQNTQNSDNYLFPSSYNSSLESYKFGTDKVDVFVCVPRKSFPFSFVSSVRIENVLEKVQNIPDSGLTLAGNFNFLVVDVDDDKTKGYEITDKNNNLSLYFQTWSNESVALSPIGYLVLRNGKRMLVKTLRKDDTVNALLFIEFQLKFSQDSNYYTWWRPSRKFRRR
ncbi:MAG: hypothetical protein NZT61_07905 [Deltaproteobacteria bacterium]|nr:hypothetical protein [Deltaproteobacteria bacterium]